MEDVRDIKADLYRVKESVETIVNLAFKAAGKDAAGVLDDLFFDLRTNVLLLEIDEIVEEKMGVRGKHRDSDVIVEPVVSGSSVVTGFDIDANNPSNNPFFAKKNKPKEEVYDVEVVSSAGVLPQKEYSYRPYSSPSTTTTIKTTTATPEVEIMPNDESTTIPQVEIMPNDKSTTTSTPKVEVVPNDESAQVEIISDDDEKF